uniref:Uncharacterized protein n=1 Tax=Kalanchoe fedtschenkoi TaxID=63787 RepID=A0A7N0ZVT8_KALFE
MCDPSVGCNRCRFLPQLLSLTHLRVTKEDWIIDDGSWKNAVVMSLLLYFGCWTCLLIGLETMKGWILIFIISYDSSKHEKSVYLRACYVFAAGNNVLYLLIFYWIYTPAWIINFCECDNSCEVF